MRDVVCIVLIFLNPLGGPPLGGPHAIFFRRRKVMVLVFAIAALADCSTNAVSPPDHPPSQDSPLVGRIFDTRGNTPISREELLRRASASPLVILGEVHDNGEHHRLQAEVLEALLRAGRTPALAMEQFDHANQTALDAARGERDPERLADAGRFDRKGWGWALYKPLVELAAANGLPLLAANLSREAARAVIKSGRPAPNLAPALPDVQLALEADIVRGHCGVRPAAALLAGMVEAQRARDAQMAEVLVRAGPGGAVLVAGTGHARRDRGAPAYLPPPLQEQLLSIAFVEVDPGQTRAQMDYRDLYDFVWFTPRAAREDPCKSFRLPKAS